MACPRDLRWVPTLALIEKLQKINDENMVTRRVVVDLINAKGLSRDQQCLLHDAVSEAMTGLSEPICEGAHSDYVVRVNVGRLLEAVSATIIEKPARLLPEYWPSLANEIVRHYRELSAVERDKFEAAEAESRRQVELKVERTRRFLLSL